MPDLALTSQGCPLDLVAEGVENLLGTLVVEACHLVEVAVEVNRQVGYDLLETQVEVETQLVEVVEQVNLQVVEGLEGVHLEAWRVSGSSGSTRGSFVGCSDSARSKSPSRLVSGPSAGGPAGVFLRLLRRLTGTGSVGRPGTYIHVPVSVSLLVGRSSW